MPNATKAIRRQIMLEQYNACRKQLAVRVEMKDGDTFPLVLGKEPKEPNLAGPMGACFSCISPMAWRLAGCEKANMCDCFEAVERNHKMRRSSSPIGMFPPSTLPYARVHFRTAFTCLSR